MEDPLHHFFENDKRRQPIGLSDSVIHHFSTWISQSLKKLNINIAFKRSKLTDEKVVKKVSIPMSPTQFIDGVSIYDGFLQWRSYWLNLTEKAAL